MIYFASPYTNDDPAIMQQRFEAVCRAAGAMMARGEVVFSPIAHTHPIAAQCDLPRDWSYWESVDREFLSAATELRVLMLPGWATSRGVSAEIAIANRRGIPIVFMPPEKPK